MFKKVVHFCDETQYFEFNYWTYIKQQHTIIKNIRIDNIIILYQLYKTRTTCIITNKILARY